MNLLKHFPRLVAAALFAATASTAVVVADATHAGSPSTSTGIFASSPATAEAAVVSVGVGFGPNRYWRYGWRGGSWVRLGYYYGAAPGYIPGGYYVGYGPPAYPYYYHRPYYYGHPYYGYRGWYGHPYWGGYGHGWYGGSRVSVGFRF